MRAPLGLSKARRIRLAGQVSPRTLDTESVALGVVGDLAGAVGCWDP